MEESQEIWLMTTISILFACGLAHFLRWGFNILMGSIAAGSTRSAETLVTRQNVLRYISELVNAMFSTFMLIVGTYEKCLLVGKGLLLEYYSTTLVLAVIYSYTLYHASPNPLYFINKYWKELTHYEEKEYVSTNNNNNSTVTNQTEETFQVADGLRRRGGEAPSVVPITSENMMRSQRRKPHDSLWTFLKLSGPSLIGQLLGLKAALYWLHLAWEGYLSDHHLDNTGLLQSCIIVLNTGVIQGFVVEAFVAFFTLVFTDCLTRIPKQGTLGILPRSYFLTACSQSIAITTLLYFFINITGSFGNPLLAYAIERKCLTNAPSVISHIIVYVFGALAGSVLYQVVPQSKHLSSILFLICGFVFTYAFVPEMMEKNFTYF